MTPQAWRNFWSKVQIGPGCWLWLGAVTDRGYGVFAARYTDGSRGTIGAHRLALIYRLGSVPKGAFACHTCDVKRCVRPDHLYIGDAKSNAWDTIRRKRKPQLLTADLVAKARAIPRDHRGWRKRGEIERLARQHGVKAATLKNATNRHDAWQDLEARP